MASSLGQYCINVTDLERSVAFYEALGLENTSRTEIPQAFEAIVEPARTTAASSSWRSRRSRRSPSSSATPSGSST